MVKQLQNLRHQTSFSKADQKLAENEFLATSKVKKCAGKLPERGLEIPEFNFGHFPDLGETELESYNRED